MRVVDTIPEDLTLDLQCMRDLLPPGVTVSYDPAAREVTFLAGDFEITTAPTQWLFHESNGAPRLRICATVDSLAQPGDTHVNRVQATAANAENEPIADATIQPYYRWREDPVSDAEWTQAHSINALRDAHAGDPSTRSLRMWRRSCFLIDLASRHSGR